MEQKTGYVKALNAETVGKISVALGAGRVKKEDKIDKTVGIILRKKISDRVEKGEILAYVYANNEEKGKQAVNDLQESYEIVTNKCEQEKYILGVI